jgi:hypothetical protein
MRDSNLAVLRFVESYQGKPIAEVYEHDGMMGCLVPWFVRRALKFSRPAYDPDTIAFWLDSRPKMGAPLDRADFADVGKNAEHPWVDVDARSNHVTLIDFELGTQRSWTFDEFADLDDADLERAYHTGRNSRAELLTAAGAPSESPASPAPSRSRSRRPRRRATARD